MTVLLSLSNTPIWQAIVADCNFPKVKQFSIFDTNPANFCVEEGVDIHFLEDLLNHFSDVIVCYKSPEDMLAELFIAEQDASVAIAQSINFYISLLNLHRKARRKLSLVSLRDIAQADADSIKTLSNLGLGLQSPLPANVDSIHTMIAIRAIQQDEELHSICQALQASSLSLVSEPMLVDITTLLKSFNEQQTRLESTEQQNSILNDALVSNEALLSDATQEQELLRSSICEFQDRAAVEAEKYLQLRDRLLEMQQALNVVELQKAELVAENQLFQKTVDSLQIELDTKNEALQETQDIASTLVQQLENKKIENEELIAEQHLSVTTTTSLLCHLDYQTTVADELKQALFNAKVASSDVIQDLERLLSEAIAENSLLEEKVRSLLEDSVTLEIAQETLCKLNLELLDKSEALKESELKANELLLNLDNTVAINSKLGKENNNLKEEKRKLNEEVTRSNDEKVRLKSENLRESKQLKREISQLESKYQKITRELLSATDKLQYAEYELTRIKSSASWKIGAPARAVARKLKKEDGDDQILKQNLGLLYTSEFFDTEWYLRTYPDIREAGVEPAEHYLIYGAKEGRFPCSSFDGDWYLRQNPDVAESGMNPLIHYIKYGMAEGRDVSPKLLNKY